MKNLHYHATLCRVRRILRTSNPAALILPPAPPGSLGDEAMLLATLGELRRRGVSNIGILTYNMQDSYVSAIDIKHYQLKDYLRHGREEGLLRFISHAQKYTHFYLIGADVMDGYYSRTETLAKIELARVAALCGLKTTFLGFSFNANPDEVCVNALRGLPTHIRIYARDPISQRRLSKWLGREVLSGADLAFLLPPEANRPEARTYVDRLKQLKREGRILVGINIAYLVLGKTPTWDEVDLLLAYLRNTLLGIAALNPSITFVLIPHDLRGPMNDWVLSERLAAGLGKTLNKNQIVHVTESLNSAEIKAICAQLDAAFTCRMHVGIACLSQGVPIAAIGYQGKFEGLMELFSLQRLLLQDVDVTSLNPADFSTLLDQLIENRTLKAIVCKRLHEVRLLAKSNFAE